MAVKVYSVRYNETEKTALISLFADKEADVTPTYGADVIPTGYTIAQGSRCKVATGEVYYYTSENKWVKDESGGGGGGDDRPATEQEVEDTIDDIVDNLHI